jgi:hypothetical protein
MRLREALHDVAEASPPLDVQADLFDRAWRVRRRRRFQAALAILVLSAAVLTVTWLPGGRIVQPGQSGDGLPSQVVTPPWQSADIGRAPLGAALVVFAGSHATESVLGHSWPLTLVGTDDQYRIYQRPEWTISTSGRTFHLSPNGRALLMPYWLAGYDARTRLLDLTSGSVRIIDAGLPLAWSPDGGEVILVHYDGDPTGGGNLAGSIRVVDPLSGRIVWEFSLPATSRFADGLVAALSPDGSQLAVQQGTSLTVHRRSGGIAWQRTLAVERLAGPAAWTPDGRRLAIVGATGQLNQLDTDAGELVPNAGWSTIRPQLIGVPGDEVIGWRGDTPVVQTNDRVVLLTDPAQVLVSTPDGTGELAVAADRLGQPPHHPGPPHGGPLLVRPGYLGMMVLAAVSLAALVGVPATILRRRWRRRAG